MKAKFEKIKAAILKNCGGFANASDSEIRSKWNSLPGDVQKQYLDSVEKEKPDASGTRSKSNV